MVLYAPDEPKGMAQAVKTAMAAVEEHLRRILAEQFYGEIHIQIKPGKVVVSGQSSSQFDLPLPK